MIKNLKESIGWLEKANRHNPNRYIDGIDRMEYNIEEGCTSIEVYEKILKEVKKYNPKRVIDIGSNLNLFGFLFENEGIEYIGIDKYKEAEPIQTEKIKFIHSDYYDVKDKFENDICISCLCVGYLIPRKDVKCKKIITNEDV